mgnify:CR=1 FL=1
MSGTSKGNGRIGHITAIEGGINYWCDTLLLFDEHQNLLNYQKPSSFQNAWTAKVITDDGEHLVFTQLDFQRALEAPLVRIDETFDAETADILIQQAVFGEIVYG